MAILLVLIGHTFARASKTSPAILAPLANAELGVELFFVLSGYLITSILVRERVASGRVSLRRFYARRSLRIWPAFYCMIAVTVLLAHFGHTVKVTGGEALSAGLFVWNYSPASHAWWLGHTWSLSIEEQFYLLWPLVLLLCKPRRALMIALAVVAAEPFVRVASYVGHIGARGRLPVYLHTRADLLMMGAALALLPVVWPRVHERMVAIVARYRLGWIVIPTLVVSSWLSAIGHGSYDLSVGMTVDGLCAVAILLAVQQPGALRRVLAFRPLVMLGVISFSLYLYQQLFMGGVVGSVAEAPILAIAAATASYWLVERPFLRLKRRFEARAMAVEPAAVPVGEPVLASA